MGHVPLNLHRIMRAESSTCALCNQEEETVHHYLFECPAWRHKRWMLAMKMGQDSKSLTHLLNSSKGVEQLTKFTGSTERFKHRGGGASET